MCDQSFLEPPAAPLPGSTAEIPDIFDVLAGGEDEGTVRCLSAINPQSHMCRYLLGYQENGGLMGCVEGFTNMEGGEEQLALPLTPNYPALSPNTSTETSAAPRSPVVVRPAQPSDAGALAAANKKRDTSGSKVNPLSN